MGFYGIYPLVIKHSYGKIAIYGGFYHKQSWFSLAMLNYQRVQSELYLQYIRLQKHMIGDVLNDIIIFHILYSVFNQCFELFKHWEISWWWKKRLHPWNPSARQVVLARRMLLNLVWREVPGVGSVLWLVYGAIGSTTQNGKRLQKLWKSDENNRENDSLMGFYGIYPLSN